LLKGQWISRASGNNQPLMLWPPRSLDIIPCDFFISSCQKNIFSFSVAVNNSITLGPLVFLV
jgi:hypothetical protein